MAWPMPLPELGPPARLALEGNRPRRRGGQPLPESTHAVMEKIRTGSLVLYSDAVQFGQLIFGDG